MKLIDFPVSRNDAHGFLAEAVALDAEFASSIVDATAEDFFPPTERAETAPSSAFVNAPSTDVVVCDAPAAPSQMGTPAKLPTQPTHFYRAEYDPQLGTVFRPVPFQAFVQGPTGFPSIIRIDIANRGIPVPDPEDRSAPVQLSVTAPSKLKRKKQGDVSEALLQGAKIGREAKSLLTDIRHEYWAKLFEEMRALHPSWSREQVAQMVAVAYLDDPPINHNYKKATLTSKTIVAAAKRFGTWE